MGKWKVRSPTITLKATLAAIKIVIAAMILIIKMEAALALRHQLSLKS